MFFLCYRLKTALFLADNSFVCSVKGEVWEVVDDVHCLRADIDDSTGNVIVLMEVCARTAWDAERLQGQKYGKKRKAKKVGRSFCKKSGFMRIEEACFDTEGKKKGERVKRK